MILLLKILVQSEYVEKEEREKSDGEIKAKRDAL
jgi:hypothetical protein